jgi:hypothetical protein
MTNHVTLEVGDWCVYNPKPDHVAYEVLSIEPIPGHCSGALQAQLRSYNTRTKQRFEMSAALHILGLIRKKDGRKISPPVKCAP